MAIEKVLINSETYFIHQEFPAYGIDEIGNPMFLGEDYLKPELLSIDKSLSKEEQVCYTFEVNDFDPDGFKFCYDVTQSEDYFIAYCSLEIEGTKNPTSLIHKNGDKWDNSPQNLAWDYCDKS